MSKKHAQEKHFANRCLQRIGYVPDYKELVHKIQMNKLEFFERQSNRVTKFKWIEPVFNTHCILVYDNSRKQIVTVLFDI